MVCFVVYFICLFICFLFLCCINSFSAHAVRSGVLCDLLLLFLFVLLQGCSSVRQAVESAFRGPNSRVRRHDVTATMPAVCGHGSVLAAVFIKSAGEK